MNDSMVVCPRCQKEVTLMIQGRIPTCPECGMRFQYRVPGGAPASEKPESDFGQAVGDVFLAIVKVVCFMVVIVLVGLAVLFAGCVVMISGHH